MDAMKIRVPDLASRPMDFKGWSRFWTETEMVEVFNRYCDIKDRETKYRQKSALELKALKAYVKDQGIDISSL